MGEIGDPSHYLEWFIIKHNRVPTLEKVFLIKTDALFLSFVYYKINYMSQTYLAST